MKYTIYLDVLFLINFCMDGIILWLTSLVCRQSVIWWRYLTGSFLGSFLFICLIWLPISVPKFVYICGYGSVGLLMCYLTFVPRSFCRMIRCYCWQLGITFLLGGTMNWLYFSTPFGTWLNHLFREQGLQLGEFGLLGMATVVIMIVLTTGFRQVRSYEERVFYHVSLYLEDKHVSGTGLIDTGNFLTEPMSGRPVVVADVNWLMPILDDDYQLLVMKYLEHNQMDYDLIAERKLIRAKWIPYQSISESGGELLGIQCDRLIMESGKKCLVQEPVIVGISESLTEERHYQMLLHTAFIE